MSVEEEEKRSRALDELCAMALAVMGMMTSPPSSSSSSSSPPLGGSRRKKKMTVSGLALLLLGVSVAMMTCGWVTFLLGFMLMPWVLSLLLFLYVVGALSTLAVLARRFLLSFSSSAAANACCSHGFDPKGASSDLGEANIGGRHKEGLKTRRRQNGSMGVEWDMLDAS